MLAYACLVLFGVASVADVPDPRPAGWVTDQAHVLDATATASLESAAAELHRARGLEVAIVTVDSTPGPSKPFATQLFNEWKLGTAQANNGVLVLLVMATHRLEIETGKGIEPALPAAWLAQMEADAMVPAFKRKDFGGGLVAGVQAIGEHLRAAGGESESTAPQGEYRSNGAVTEHAAPPPPPPPRAYAPPPRDDGMPVGEMVAIGLIAVGVLLFIVWVVRRGLRDPTGRIDDPGPVDAYSGPSVRTGFWDFFGGSSSSSSSSSSGSWSDSSSSSDTSSGSDSSSSGGGSSDGGGAGSDW